MALRGSAIELGPLANREVVYGCQDEVESSAVSVLRGLYPLQFSTGWGGYFTAMVSLRQSR